MATTTARLKTRGTATLRAIRWTRRIVLYLIVVGGAFGYMYPVLFMLRTSLTKESDLYVLPPIIIPWPPLWENYSIMWSNGPTWSWMKNSAIVVAFSVVAETITSVSVAYGFARTRFAGRDKLFLGVLATMMLPGAVTLIPRWLIFHRLDMIDTLWPLLIPRLFGTAFYIFIMRQFFLTLPRELDDAARIDGASHLQILRKVVIPLSVPAIATIAVFSFMNRWNDFLEPLIYLLRTENLTLAVGLRFFVSRFGTQYHLLMAGAMLLIVPMIVAFFLAQKQFIRGIALTGIKG